jgi:hypothetical protein
MTILLGILIFGGGFLLGAVMMACFAAAGRDDMRMGRQ